MPRHAILITLHHLAASQIGAYGQYRTRTPALDQFASRSAVFHNAQCLAVSAVEQCPIQDWTECPLISAALNDWTSRGISIETIAQSHEQPPRDWVRNGVAAIRSQLASNQPGVTWLQGIGIPDPWVPDHTGWDIEVARLLGTSWEELLADESDEMTPDRAVQELVAEGEFSRHRRAENSETVVKRLSLALYAACVEKLDDRLGRLIREYQRHAHSDSLLILTALQGDELPHQLPIQRPVQLHAERVRVPLVVQEGMGHAGGATVLELVQTPDVIHTIAGWMSPLADASFESPSPAVDLLEVASKSAPGRSHVLVTSTSGEILVRTPDAQLVIRAAYAEDQHSETVEWLTLKPEDTWDLLNVADQHHDLVDTLRSLGG